MSNFKVGEKVVCINPVHNLIKNEIYTVSCIFEKFGEYGILVSELQPIATGILNGLYYYSINRFRKLDHQFAEDLCKELAEQAKEEQLILN